MDANNKRIKGEKMLFVCPICADKLEEIKNISADGKIISTVARCGSGHSFDKSKDGYYNLLLSNSGGTHGDNKDMVLARREFLGYGFYRTLAYEVANTVLGSTKSGGAVLDAGCGEGYYTDISERALFSRDGESCVYAFDISKSAVREVKKKNLRINLAVAGSYRMPIADESFDTVINTFSPQAIDETKRVLKRGGRFIMAIPGEEHLFDLKAKIYDTPYKNTVADTALDGFELISDKSIRYKMHLDSAAAVRSLFMMTPYAYRTKKENAERILLLDSLDCTADFRLFEYQKL